MAQSAQQVAENLRDAGCTEDFIGEFLRAMAQDSPQTLRQMLDRQRERILDKVHDQQRKLECFDYLRYQFQTEQEE